MTIEKVKQIISDAMAGKIFIISDEVSRENEGDLTVAAELITPEIINFMITHAKGLVCLSITEKLRASLDLAMVPKRNRGQYDTGFATSFDAGHKHEVSTGISAYDRAASIKAALTGDGNDLRTPGHIFPVVAQEGGLKVRRGHTEASVEVMRLAEFKEPAAVICEITNPDGKMARIPDIKKFAAEHGINIITTAELVEYIENNGF